MIRNRLLPIVLLALVCLSSAAVPARAEDPTTPYTIEDVTACSQDAMRLCKNKLPDLDAIETCMKANYDSLHPACKARFHRDR